MRRQFADSLHKQMTFDNDIVLITMDLGMGMWDQIAKDYKKRFYNVGASEQAGMDIAVGMAQDGKKVFVYTISSFYMRCAEAINIYIHNEQIPVRLIGSGVDDLYKHDGYSHNCTMTQRYLELLDIKTFYPKDKKDIPQLVEDMVKLDKPSFVGLLK